MEDKFSKILSVKFENYKCFEDFTLDCRKPDGKPYQWTVLLGDNNTGKTNILRAIAGLNPIVFVFESHELFVPRVHPSLLFNPAFKIISEIKEVGFWMYEITENRALSQSSIPVGDDLYPIGYLSILGYGVTRHPSSTSLSQNDSEDCETLFSTHKHLTNIEEWLMKLDYAAKNNQDKATEQLEKIKKLLCGKIFPEIEDFKFESSKKDNTFENYVLFKTKDGWFRYIDLGFGYQSTLAWVVDLCRRMFEMYTKSEDPLKESAVVLVDEIDLHLHPKWQREVIGDLSAYFPNIQFIVTTHSPAVVQSMSDVNLYTLSRPEGKVIVTRSERSDFSGWTVEEIMRETMSLGEDVNSNIYNEQRQLFDDALDAEDKAKAKEAYEVLDKILHPNNPIRRMLRLQFQSIDSDD